jgi:aryl-alcohol dehydrogenase-like predicted oxidoreductase
VIAEEADVTPAQIAIAWVLAQAGEHNDIVPIPGTKRVARLEENLGADTVTLTDDQLNRLDQLTPPVGEHHSEDQMALIER